MNIRIRIRIKYSTAEKLTKAFRVFFSIMLLLMTLHYILSTFINYRDPLHVQFVLTMVFSYVGTIFMLLLNPQSSVKAQGEKVSKYLILMEVAVILVIGTWVFSAPFRNKTLPVGYDTPVYVGIVDLLISGKMPLLEFRRRMGYFTLLYLVTKIFNLDPITLGRLLQLQGVFLAISVYFYTMTLMNHKAALLSGLFTIVWSRTHRVVADLHANTAGLSLLYIFFAVHSLKLKKYIKVILLIILLMLIASVHEMPLVILLCTLSAFYGYELIQSKDKKRRIIGVLIPSIPFILCVVTSYVLSISWRGDLTRKWWPEVSIFSYRFLYLNRPEYLCLFAPLSIPRLICTSSGSILLLYTLISILFSQNFYFGLHALPERFLVLIPLPTLASIGYISLLRYIFQRMPRLRPVMKKKLITGLFITITSIILVPAVEKAELCMAQTPCYITNEEYDGLLYLKHHISSKGLNKSQVLILFPRYGMKAWFTYLGGQGAVYSARGSIVKYFKKDPNLKYIYLIVPYRRKIPRLDSVYYRIIYRNDYIQIYEVYSKMKNSNS